MKKIILFISFLFFGVLTFANTSVKKQPKAKAKKVVKMAHSYLGTRHQLGGLSKSGIDCSGLVYTVFKSNRVKLPRTAYQMSKRGKKIKPKKAEPGDLIFFSTGRTRKVNHVGIVTDASKKGITFIHTSSSRGVIYSKLTSNYWKKNFRLITRVL